MQRINSSPLRATLAGLVILLGMTATVDIQGSGSSSSERISAATATAEDESPEADATEPRPNSSAATGEVSTKAEPTAAPAPSVTSGGTFLWEPRSDSIRVVIPADLPHWQLHVASRRRHVTLYGPDNRGGNRAQNVEYILSGGGAVWRQKSLDAGDDGTLLVFINTRDVETGALRNAGWRIMNPSARQSGDGDRLVAGENR